MAENKEGTGPLLQVVGVSKAFGGFKAVQGVDLAIPAYARCAVIGPNGAGKTTLFNVITRKLRPDRGAVMFDQVRVDRMAPAAIARRGMVRTFQITSVFADLSTVMNVQFCLFIKTGVTRRLFLAATAFQREVALTLLEEMGLADKAEVLVRELSYGERHRLELAMTLALDPKLLVLDEPAAGLGERERRQIGELLMHVSQRRALTLLFSDHDMDLVFGLADMVLVLSQGQVLAVGRPDDIRANVEVKRIYLGSA